MYCNLNISIRNVMSEDESDWIVNKRNGLQYANMIWDGMETGSSFSMRNTEYAD